MSLPYEKASQALRTASLDIDKLSEDAFAEAMPEGALAQVEDAVANLLAVERGQALGKANDDLCRATLNEVTRLGGWKSAPDILVAAFEKGFAESFAGSLGAIFKTDDKVFRIWRVLEQPATNETLAAILSRLENLTPSTGDREAVAVAIAGNREILNDMATQLKTLAGQFKDIKNDLKVIRDDTTNIRGDTTVIRSQTEEMLSILGQFLTQGDTSPETISPNARPRLFNLTSTPNRKFTGRAQMLAKLDENIRAGTRTAITAVHGMGGTGKTTLAREYVFEYATAVRFAGMWWIPAEAPAAILSA